MPATILVVDDEPTLLDLLATALADEGYQVLCAADGAEARTVAERDWPDLVVADVRLPRLSGADLAACLRGREDGYGPPIMLLSAEQPPAPLPERTVFLAKPFDLDELVATVAGLLPVDC